MFFRITSDTNEESGIAKVAEEISGSTRIHFNSHNYGTGLLRMCVVLMCRDPKLKFKQRIRFTKKDKTLYLDVMLNLPEMVNLSHKERYQVVIDKLLSEIPKVLTKYRFKNFEKNKFESDLQEWFYEKNA